MQKISLNKSSISSTDGLYIPLNYYAFLNNVGEQEKIKTLLPKHYRITVEYYQNEAELKRLNHIFKTVKTEKKKPRHLVSIQLGLVLLICLSGVSLTHIKKTTAILKKQVMEQSQKSRLSALKLKKIKDVNDRLHLDLAHILKQPLSIIHLSISPIHLDLRLVKNESARALRKLIAPHKAKIYEEEFTYDVSITR